MANELFGSNTPRVERTNTKLFSTSTDEGAQNETQQLQLRPESTATQTQEMANRSASIDYVQGKSDSIEGNAELIMRSPLLRQQEQVASAVQQLQAQHQEQFLEFAQASQTSAAMREQGISYVHQVMEEDKAELAPTNPMSADYAYINQANLNQTAEESELATLQRAVDSGQVGAVPTSKEAKDKLALSLYISRKIGEVWDKTSKTDVAIDSAFLMVPGTQLVQDERLTMKLKDSDNPVVSWVGEADTTAGMRERFMKLNAKQQTQVVDALFENMPHVSDNKIRWMSWLSDITGISSEAETMGNQALALGEGAGIVSDVAKVGKIAGEVGKIKLVQKFKGRTPKVFAQEDKEIKEKPLTVKREVPFDGTEVDEKGVFHGSLSDSYRRIRSRIRQAMGNPTLAGEESRLAAMDSRVAMSMGVTREEAAMSAMPVNFKGLLTGAAPEEAARIQKTWERMDKEFELAKMSPDSGVGSLLSTEEKENTLNGIRKTLEQEPEVSNVSFGEITDKGYSVTYDYKDPMTGVVEPVTSTERWTTDSITGNPQMLDAGNIRSGLYKVLSPSVTLGEKVSKLFVHAPDRADALTAKLAGYIDKQLISIQKEIGRKGMKKLDHILRKGDLDGHEYRYDELVQNGNLGDVPALTPEEYKGYSQVRKIAKQMFALHNEAIRKEKKARGIKKVHVINGETGEELNFLGKVLGDEEAAKYVNEYQVGAPSEARFVSKADKIWVPHMDAPLNEVRTSLHLPEGPLDYQALKHKGWRVVNIDGGDFISSRGTGYRTVLVKSLEDTFSEIGDTEELLSWHRGWMPLAYKDAYYFAKETLDTNVIDSLGNIQKEVTTLRYFNKVEDAHSWVEAQKAANPARKIEVVHDGEMPTELAEQAQNAIYGGMGTRVRKQERLPYGIEGQAAKYNSSLESLTRSAARINRRYAFSEVKIAMADTMRKQLTRLGVETDTMSLQDMEHAIDMISDSHIRAGMKVEMSQLRQVIGIPTAEELSQRRFYVNLADRLIMQDSVLSKVPGLTKAIYSFGRARLPQQWLKEATFHCLLGLFNPSQFIVQGASAAAAFAIAGPTVGTKAIRHATALHFFDLAQRNKFREHAISRGVEMGSDKELIGAWERSGLYEQSRASKGAYLDVYDGMQMTKNRIAKLLDIGTFFFEQGELVNTRYSFSCAYEEWKGLNKGRALDDAGLRWVMSRTTELKTNMSNFNKTMFQKHSLLSIPTQFMQVMTKAFEQGAGMTGLSKAQIARFWSVPVMMFGTSGGIGNNRLGNAIYSTAVGAMGIDEDNPDSQTAYALKHGIVGWGLNQIAGIDADIGGRVALTSGLFDGIADLMTGNSNALEVTFGPSSTLVSRSIEAGRELTMGFQLAGVDDFDDIDTLTMLKLIPLEFFSVLSSSFRNAIAGFMMYESDTMRGSDGKVMWSHNQRNMDAFIKGFGFQPNSSQEYYENRYGDNKWSNSKILPDAVKVSVTLMYKLGLLLGNNADGSLPTDSVTSVSQYNDSGEAAERQIRAYRQMLACLHEMFQDDPMEYKRYLDGMSRQIKSGMTTEAQYLSRQIQNAWHKPVNKRDKLMTSPSIQAQLEKVQQQ